MWTIIGYLTVAHLTLWFSAYAMPRIAENQRRRPVGVLQTQMAQKENGRWSSKDNFIIWEKLSAEGQHSWLATDRRVNKAKYIAIEWPFLACYIIQAPSNMGVYFQFSHGSLCFSFLVHQHSHQRIKYIKWADKKLFYHSLFRVHWVANVLVVFHIALATSLNEEDDNAAEDASQDQHCDGYSNYCTLESRTHKK